MKSDEIKTLSRHAESISVKDGCVSDHFADVSKMVTRGSIDLIARRTLTSFLHHSNNKTTSVENKLSRIFNLITSFIKNGLLKLGNEVFIIFPFIRATEVVLLVKLGGNEVIFFSQNNQKSKIKNQK